MNQNEEDRKLKAFLKERVVADMESEKSFPHYYYNMACLYSLFEEYDECEKYFNW